MGIYRCNRCDGLKDDDWDGAFEDPFDECELICESCSEEAHERPLTRAEAIAKGYPVPLVYPAGKGP